MSSRIVAVSDRPELAPLVARWRIAAFAPAGHTVETMTALILAPQAPEETFVLFDGDAPAGTAALSRSDLKARPDLTPWLADVVVDPAFRARGHATALVRRVEACALAASVPVLWLHTATAAPLYERLGWARVRQEHDGRHAVVLMRRALS